MDGLKNTGSVDRNGVPCENHDLPGKDAVYDRELDAFATQIEEMCEGLCLQCVKGDEDGIEITCEREDHR